MNRRPKPIQVLALLPVLLMGALLAMPPGLHLELCVGDGDHFEVSLGSCPDDPSSLRQMRGVTVLDQIHHDECLDLAVVCDSLEEILHSAGRAGPLRDSSPAAGLPASASSAFLAAPAAGPSPRLVSQTLSPSHLAPLRTVVLLS